MKSYINVMPDPVSGFGQELLQRFHSMGFRGVRHDVVMPVDPWWVAGISDLEKEKSLHNIYLIFGGHMTKERFATDNLGSPWAGHEMPAFCAKKAQQLRDHGLGRAGEAIEIGNEPDLAHRLWKENPTGLANVVNKCYDAIREILPEVTILCPSISNLNSRGFNYLNSMLKILRPEIGVAFHRYPAGETPHHSHKGFQDRNEEFQKLLEMAGTRDLWGTETGFSNENPKSEQDQATYIETDMRFNRDRGLEHYCLYQLNDGAEDTRMDRYGIRHFDEEWDGDWKLIAQQLFPWGGST